MIEKYIESERGKTYYWIEKKADAGRKALVFLPGLTANHHLFDLQISCFSSSYTVITWDAPGHGKSRPYADFSYSHLAKELKTILDQEQIQKVVLIGQSAGGFVSQSFITNYGDMAEGLFTIGTCPYGTDYYSRSDIFWLKQTEWMARLIPDKILRRSMANMCGVTETAKENMLKMLKDYSKKELCHLMYLGFAGFVPEIRDLKIPCPVYLTVGAKDRTGKVRAYNEMWSRKEGYPLHIIEGASHNANVDKPAQINQLIKDFLADIAKRVVF